MLSAVEDYPKTMMEFEKCFSTEEARIVGYDDLEG